MALLAVLCLVLLFLAALGQTWWWRNPAGPGPMWYGNALFFWGVFLFALCNLWPVIRALAHT